MILTANEVYTQGERCQPALPHTHPTYKSKWEKHRFFRNETQRCWLLL